MQNPKPRKYLKSKDFIATKIPFGVYQYVWHPKTDGRFMWDSVENSALFYTFDDEEGDRDILLSANRCKLEIKRLSRILRKFQSNLYSQSKASDIRILDVRHQNRFLVNARGPIIINTYHTRTFIGASPFKGEQWHSHKDITDSTVEDFTYQEHVDFYQKKIQHALDCLKIIFED